MTTRDRRIASATRQAVSYRNYRRARDRALSRLATAYPETYKELLELEKASDITEGKKWLDIDGSTGVAMDTSTSREAAIREQTRSDYSKTQGYNGGEE